MEWWERLRNGAVCARWQREVEADAPGRSRVWEKAAVDGGQGNWQGAC